MRGQSTAARVLSYFVVPGHRRHARKARGRSPRTHDSLEGITADLPSAVSMGEVVSASGDAMNVVAIEDLVFVINDVKFSTRVKIVDGLRERLLSVMQLCREGWSVAFTESNAVLRRSGVSIVAKLVNGLHVVPLSVVRDDVSCALSAREARGSRHQGRCCTASTRAGRGAGGKPSQVQEPRDLHIVTGTGQGDVGGSVQQTCERALENDP